MESNKIIGYVVKNNSGEFIEAPNADFEFNHVVNSRPAPVGRSDAFRRLAAFLDENADRDPEADSSWIDSFYIAPTYYQPTPMEKAAKELSGHLQSLCSRHGLDLGLTQEQIQKQIVKELEELKAGGSTFVVTGIPQIR